MLIKIRGMIYWCNVVIEVQLIPNQSLEYVSLTDIARFMNPSEPKDVIKNWMRSRTIIEFLGLWEKLHNPSYKGVEFDSFLFEAGSNSFDDYLQ